MSRFFILLLFVTFLGACSSNQSDQNASKPNNGTGTAAPTSSNNTQATAAASEDPRPAIIEVLQGCTKVEYMVYDAGITFESESTNEVLRFFSYISNNVPGTGCPPDKFDGNVVFKNAQGEIKVQLQFNLPALSNCNRVTFKHKDKVYERTLDPNGLQFFGQVLNMRNQVGKQ